MSQPVIVSIEDATARSHLIDNEVVVHVITGNETNEPISCFKVQVSRHQLINALRDSAQYHQLSRIVIPGKLVR